MTTEAQPDTPAHFQQGKRIRNTHDFTYPACPELNVPKGSPGTMTEPLDDGRTACEFDGILGGHTFPADPSDFLEPLPEEKPAKKKEAQPEKASGSPLPWFHRHPMGGCEIYADSQTHEPLAVFKSAADCDMAIAAVNSRQSLCDALEGLLSAQTQHLNAVSMHERSVLNGEASDVRDLLYVRKCESAYILESADEAARAALAQARGGA